MTEFETIRAALSDEDEGAFARLFTQHRDRLKQMLQFRMDPRLRQRTDLSDVLQESYIDAYRRLDHYTRKPGLSFYVWLRQITMQRLIDLHRQHLLAEKRNARNEVPLAGVDRGAVTSAVMARELVDQIVSPSQAAIHQEMVSQLELTLDSMDEMDREVLALRHFEELRNGEVAEVLGITDAAASNRYVRALSRLREALKLIPDFFDE